MAKDATRVRVALNGNIWVADEGAAMPADVETAPGLGWTDLGYTTDDGVTFTISRETEDIPARQTPDPLRTLATSEPKQAAFTLRQLERATWVSTLGGTVTETGADTGLFRWTPGAAGVIPVKAMLIDFQDGDLLYRIGFRRAQQLGEVEFSLVRNDAVNLPNEWHALAASGVDSAWYVDTNDPAWEPAA